MIRALVFDFDGLILDTETALIDACELVHRRHGRPFPRELAREAVGRAELHFDQWAAFGPEADRVALGLELHRANREIVSRQPVLPGVEDYLKHGRELGLRIGLASNSSHEHVERHLKGLGLRHHFECLRCIDDVPAGKPEPHVYRAVLEAFGVTGHEAVAFEDSEHGAEAARRAGLWCVAVPGPSSRDHDFSRSSAILASLADCPLTDLLARFTDESARRPQL